MCSADGNYEIRLTNTKARVTFAGELQWRPPAIWAYSCIINVASERERSLRAHTHTHRLL